MSGKHPAIVQGIFGRDGFVPVRPTQPKTLMKPGFKWRESKIVATNPAIVPRAQYLVASDLLFSFVSRLNETD